MAITPYQHMAPTMTAAKILVIEDDSDINQLVTMNLQDMDYQVDCSDDGKRGYELAVSDQYDAIILDLMLPNMDGLAICQQLRAQQNFTPILMLTAKGSETDRIVGLEMGADDYLTKPFSVRELQARTKALLRRSLHNKSAQQPQDSDIELRDLSIRVQQRQVLLKGKPIELTSTEFDLLHYLARKPGHVFSRAQLLDKVWGYHHSGYEHTVNSHINRLRAKLDSASGQQHYVLTVWGVGYKFTEQ